MQTQPFDPDVFPDKQHAARSLTLVLRGLRLGERAVLPDGTLVQSIGIRHGAHVRRRYAVVPKGSGSAGARHKALVLGKSSFPSASEAAHNALGIGEQDAAQVGP